MERRNLIKAGLAGLAAAVAAPYVAKADKSFQWRMTTAWPPGLPMYQSGPGSAEDMARKIDELSDGRLKIQVFAAGELIPAFGGFDAVSSGTVEMNHACAYYWAGKHSATQYFTTVPFGTISAAASICGTSSTPDSTPSPCRAAVPACR
jgi:TRAP-type mannitol/chloroaromatic compound transport system substrate-binding protein